MKRGKPLRQVSKKRRRDLKTRAKVRAVVLERDQDCVARLLVPQVTCGGRGEVHEPIPRSAWKDAWLLPEACVTVCSRHHEWIGANPDAAHALGLHGYSWERPDGHDGRGAA